MAFPSILAIPASISARFFGTNSGAIVNGAEIDFKPTLAAGTAFDLTAVSSYIVYIDNGVTVGLPAYASNNIPTSSFTGSASGGSVTLAASDILTALSNMKIQGGNGNGRINIQASDGVNSVIVAQGQYNYQFSA
jgi:hypothetical protein